MEIIICSDATEVARVAAARVAKVIRAVGPKVVIGIATGSSPIGLYNELGKQVRSGDLDLSQATAFALDEYIGLPAGPPSPTRR